jgi:hypothetical protein
MTDYTSAHGGRKCFGLLQGYGKETERADSRLKPGALPAESSPVLGWDGL